MSINNAMLIDLALNVVGYVAAGALSLVVYSMFRRGPRSATRSESVAMKSASQLEPAMMPGGTAPDNRVMQYVNFGESARNDDGPQSLTMRRNRAEVLRVARGMLRSGASDHDIKAALPVSDAELAVLNYERK